MMGKSARKKLRGSGRMRDGHKSQNNLGDLCRMRRIRRLAAFYFSSAYEKGRDPVPHRNAGDSGPRCPSSRSLAFSPSLRFVSQRREDAGRFVTVARARARARAGEPKLT